MNDKPTPTRLVKSQILGPNGARMMYDGPPVEIADAGDVEALGLRIAVLFVPKATTPQRPILAVWRIPAASAPVVLQLAARLVYGATQRGDAVHAVIIDDGEDASYHAAEGINIEIAPLRSAIEAMLRAEPDAPRVLARL